MPPFTGQCISASTLDCVSRRVVPGHERSAAATGLEEHIKPLSSLKLLLQIEIKWCCLSGGYFLRCRIWGKPGAWDS